MYDLPEPNFAPRYSFSEALGILGVMASEFEEQAKEAAARAAACKAVVDELSALAGENPPNDTTEEGTLREGKVQFHFPQLAARCTDFSIEINWNVYTDIILEEQEYGVYVDCFFQVNFLKVCPVSFYLGTVFMPRSSRGKSRYVLNKDFKRSIAELGISVELQQRILKAVEELE